MMISLFNRNVKKICIYTLFTGYAAGKLSAKNQMTDNRLIGEIDETLLDMII